MVGPLLPPPLLAWPELGGEAFHGLAALEVALHDLRHVPLREAEVPGALRVDDGVRTVLAVAETINRVYANVPEHSPLAELVL